LTPVIRFNPNKGNIMEKLLGWRTFALASIAFISTVVLVAMDKIPQVIDLTTWTTFVLAVLGTYAVKSIGTSMATKEK